MKQKLDSVKKIPKTFKTKEKNLGKNTLKARNQ